MMSGCLEGNDFMRFIIIISYAYGSHCSFEVFC